MGHNRLLWATQLRRRPFLLDYVQAFLWARAIPPDNLALTLFLLSTSSQHPPISLAFPRGSRLAKTARKTSEIIQSCQHHNIVFGGGSLFSKYSSYKRRSILARLAKIRKSRLFAFGVSIGPFKDKDQQRKYCKLLSDFTLIVCRDKASSTYFNLENMVQGHDMAWCLPKLIPLDTSRTDKRVLVIAVSEPLAALALSELSTLPAHFDQILFIAMNTNGAGLHKALQKSFAKRFNIPTSSYYYREKPRKRSGRYKKRKLPWLAS